jgi:alkylation response protein AidB-like acyl-CoA dehydrogenase
LGFERATTRLYRQARFINEFEQLMALCVGSDAPHAPHENEHYRQRMGAMLAELTILRFHNMKAVSRIAQGARIGPEASLIKLFWSEMHQRFADLSMDVLTALSQRIGPDAERFQDIFLQSRAETIYAGTSQIQRNIISERILGLPR